MPTEVAISSYSSSFLPSSEPSHLSAETKSGSITLIATNGRKQSVNVIVYRTSLEHFAVLYPQKKICRPLGVITLKNTTVEPIKDKHEYGFIVRQQGYDTPMTLKFLCESRDLDSWLVAFTSRCSPTLRHQSSLPIVEEEEI